MTMKFSPLRSLFWPVHKNEMKLLLPLLLLIFTITFNYNVLRTMKDSLVVATGKGACVETIPFIKIWILLPASLLLTYLFTNLSNKFSQEIVFYLFMGLFLGYFFVFVSLLYPYHEHLQPTAFADRMAAILPNGCKGLVAMIRNWSFSTFYVMTELWPSFILVLLFWGFANRIVDVEQAKRFYALLGVFGNISSIVAGKVAYSLSFISFIPSLPYGKTAWDQQIFLLLSLLLFNGLFALAVFRWIHCKGFGKETSATFSSVKIRLNLKESLSILMQSRYLLSIAVISLGYQIVTNLVEIPFKQQVKELYPNPSDYNAYMNQLLMFLGFFATFTSLFVTGNVIRFFGWLPTALMTPLFILITGAIYFGSYFGIDVFNKTALTIFGVSSLSVTVFLGSLHYCFAHGAKYTVCDASKEMAYVPLDNETKLKGKAAVDGACSSLGKSSAAVIHQILFLFFASISGAAPVIALLLIFVCILWITSVRYLGKEFAYLTGSRQVEKIPSLT